MTTGLFSKPRAPRPECRTCDDRTNTDAAFTLWKVSPHDSAFPLAWEKVGRAWAHADGKGFTVISTEHPHDGIYLMRLEPEKKLREEMHRR